MRCSYKLKTRSTTPPGGFQWKLSTGHVVKSLTFRGLLDKAWPHIPENTPNPGEYLETVISQQLAEKGHPELVDIIIPPLAEQGFGKVTAIDSKNFLSPGTYYYNAGLARKGDHLLMTYRRQQHSGKSDICMCDINEENMQPVPESNKALLLPKKYPDSTYEDPSLIWHKNKLLLAYCEWEGHWHYAPAQHLCVVNPETKKVGKSYTLNYGNNHHKVEKSWMFFSHQDELFFAYYPNPLEIVKFDLRSGICQQVAKHCWDASFWRWGHLRGSCPPVRIGDEYLFIIHSAHRDNGRKLTYVVGAMCFDAKTFKPTRVTVEPFLSGNDKDSGLGWAPRCVFPRGLVVKGEDCTMSMGVNDLWTAMVRFKLNDLLSLTKPL